MGDAIQYRYVKVKRSNPTTVSLFADVELTNFVEGAFDGYYDDVVFTLASKLDQENNTVHFGWSVNAPGDNHNKKMARTIATGRLLKHPVVIERDPSRRLTDQFVEHVRTHSDKVYGKYRRVLRSLADDYIADGDFRVSVQLHKESK